MQALLVKWGVSAISYVSAQLLMDSCNFSHKKATKYNYKIYRMDYVLFVLKLSFS